MLAKQPLFMSMAGAPSSGKTYYITALIHALRQQLPRDFNLLFEYAISHDIKTIDDLICFAAVFPGAKSVLMKLVMTRSQHL
jgi:Ni2+-binding GTPase involved in maturation of urease and hydrogenase